MHYMCCIFVRIVVSFDFGLEASFSLLLYQYHYAHLFMQVAVLVLRALLSALWSLNFVNTVPPVLSPPKCPVLVALALGACADVRVLVQCWYHLSIICTGTNINGCTGNFGSLWRCHLFQQETPPE